MAGDLAEAQSFDATYQQIYAEQAPVYAVETLAAFALVDRAAADQRELLHALRFDHFATPAGPVSFRDGENNHARVSLWVYTDEHAHERRLLC